jgi:hypothetical protein
MAEKESLVPAHQSGQICGPAICLMNFLNSCCGFFYYIDDTELISPWFTRSFPSSLFRHSIRSGVPEFQELIVVALAQAAITFRSVKGSQKILAERAPFR